MKKWLITSILFLIPVFGFAQRGVGPDGFLGFKWESTISEYANLKDPPPEILNSNPNASFDDRFTNKLPGKEDIRVGIRSLGKIGEVDVLTSSYMFTEGRLCSVVTHFNQEKNYKVLKEALSLKYGKADDISPLTLKVNPDAKAGEICEWRFQNAWIRLRYNVLKERGILEYLYVPCLREGVRKQKEDVQKTKDSL